MADQDQDKDFVEYIVKALVANPNDVKVERKVDERGVLLELAINPEDMGKIIGKEGKTAKALRTLLRVLGAKMNARVNLKIAEPEGSQRPESSFKANDEEPEKEQEESATEVM